MGGLGLGSKQMSYSLNNISFVELGLQKYEYKSEGLTLDQFYEQDPMGFLLYKVIESIIVFPVAAIIPAIPLLILLVIFKAFLSQRKYGYAITDRRLIIINERYENAVALVNIYDLQIEYGNEGTGTIVVRRMDNPYSKNETDKFDHFYIQGISEPDKVFRILSDALELARKNK